MLQENFVEYIQDSIRKNWDTDALADYKGESFTYGEVAYQICRIHGFLKEAGVGKQDKIALVGKNSSRWGILYLSITSYGAVVVPVLPEFKPADTHQIINHSDARVIFADEPVFQKLDPALMHEVMCILSITDFQLLYSRSDEISAEAKNFFSAGLKSEMQVTREGFSLPKVDNDKLAVISYTSGTSGFIKGVMLEHNSLSANIRYAHRNMPLNAGDQIVSFLPLAHAFGCAFEFLFPFTLGCKVTILTKTPTPQIIMGAFQEIRPALILSVPLVIEKIFKKQLIPVIGKFYMRALLHIPIVNRVLLKKIREKLVTVFGGNFREIVVGGAPFNLEAEMFFRKLKFPFTVGYGMTECGPLISYVSWNKLKIGSSGIAVDTLEMKINSANPARIPGEILVRGENVMRGYYKNEDLTREMIDEEGWLHTGDLGLMDKQGNLFIKGRSKSMILGASGKNIYPDEIESLLNNQFAVSESLIVQRNGKLVALIYPDPETIEKHNITPEMLKKLFERHIKVVNHRFPKYMSISGIDIQAAEFIKTPKRSIKRYLYH
ncbi:MAG: AMP-binding protein [Bacteroidetes bacterium]|nr:AMP-binding protein [Bacteroidota bacterium]